MYQDPNDGDAPDVSSKIGRGSERGTAPPVALLAFPPLAYLLNTLLSGLNFLKDTPLVAVQDKILSHLEVILKDACHFLVSVSDDVRTKGKKYFSSSPDLIRAAGTLQPGCMDRVYATVINDELIMHALRCFQMIYFGDVEGEKTKRKKDAKDSPIVLEEKLQEIAENCASTLLSAGLIEKVVVDKKEIKAPKPTSDVIQIEILVESKNSGSVSENMTV